MSNLFYSSFQAYEFHSEKISANGCSQKVFQSEFIPILLHEAAESIAASARKGCEYIAGLLTVVRISPVCTDTPGYEETTERS